MADKIERINVMTPECILVFHDLFRAKAIEEGKDPTFNLTMLFSPEAQQTAEFAEMKKAAGAVAAQRFAAQLAADPNFKNYLRSPFRAVDDPDPKAQKKKAKYYSDLGPGWVYISSSTKQRPGVVKVQGAGTVPILDENEIYAGVVVRATLSPFPYDTKGNQGISFGLGNVLKIKDGPRRGGRPTADADFGAFVQANPAAAAAPAEALFGGSATGGLV